MLTWTSLASHRANSETIITHLRQLSLTLDNYHSPSPYHHHHYLDVRSRGHFTMLALTHLHKVIVLLLCVIISHKGELDLLVHRVCVSQVRAQRARFLWRGGRSRKSWALIRRFSAATARPTYARGDPSPPSAEHASCSPEH